MAGFERIVNGQPGRIARLDAGRGRFAARGGGLPAQGRADAIAGGINAGKGEGDARRAE